MNAVFACLCAFASGVLFGLALVLYVTHYDAAALMCGALSAVAALGCAGLLFTHACREKVH